MRLIDADKIVYSWQIDADGQEHDGVTLKSIIDKIPTIDTEIIHCQDCKNWDKTWTNDFSPNYHYCPMIDGVRKDNFYCADAERWECGE